MDIKEATASIASKKELVSRIRDEVSRVIVGQEKLIDRLLLALVTDGHILLEGVPGLAKTLSCNTLAKALGLDFKRISFTPDLLPADVVGTMVYSPKTGEFTPKKVLFSRIFFLPTKSTARPRKSSPLFLRLCRSVR